MSYSKFSKLPTLRIPVYAARACNSSTDLEIDMGMESVNSETEHVKRNLTKDLDMFDVVNEKAEKGYADTGVEFKSHIENGGMQSYLDKARAIPLNVGTCDLFFGQDLVHKFGITSTMSARIGFDTVNNVWKLYVKKNNPNSRSSVLQIIYAELDEVVEYLQETLAKISEGKKNKTPYLKPETMAGWKLEKSTSPTFWQHEDVWYTGSGQFRIRVLWNHNTFEIFLNLPNDSSSYDNYYGPKIRLSVRECQQFLFVVKEISSKLPNWSQMH